MKTQWCEIEGTDKDSPRIEGDTCDCGGNLVNGYGHTYFGVGSYMVCEKCSNMYNFIEDSGLKECLILDKKK